jgi:hypothetical protein
MTNCAYVLEFRGIAPYGSPSLIFGRLSNVEYFQTSICLDEHGSLIIKFMPYHPVQRLSLTSDCLAWHYLCVNPDSKY